MPTCVVNMDSLFLNPHPWDQGAKQKSNKNKISMEYKSLPGRLAANTAELRDLKTNEQNDAKAKSV